MLAAPVAAQAPAPTTTFDGKYVGTASITRDVGFCTAIPRMDMTIAGGRVVIHVIFFNGFRQTFRGSVNATGEVSTQFEWKWNGYMIDTLNGTIRDNVFTSVKMHGNYCHWRVQMSPPPPPTMPFDGDYIGISRESNGSGAECPQRAVPAELIIRNSIVRSDEASWEGTVSPQGVLAMQNRGATQVEGRIDSEGVIRGQGRTVAGCTITFVWRKQPG